MIRCLGLGLRSKAWELGASLANEKEGLSRVQHKPAAFLDHNSLATVRSMKHVGVIADNHVQISFSVLDSTLFGCLLRLSRISTNSARTTIYSFAHTHK